MKYIFDNDLHIHSKLSFCSKDPEQTPERILEYAKQNNLKTVCITDHFWDELVEGASQGYKSYNYTYISSSKPLPQADGIEFLFGCETDLNKYLTLGISKERFDLFDFIIVSITHFHMMGFTLFDNEAESAQGRADAWIRRLDALLDMDLPFYKIGLAHLTTPLISPKRDKDIYRKILELLPAFELERLFNKAAQLGVGIELNYGDMSFEEDDAELVLKPYRIAKKCGCKFYLGSDAHHPDVFYNAKAVFERAINLLELTEEDKFFVCGRSMHGL